MYISSNRQRRLTAFLFLLPSFAGLLVFNFLPMISSIVISTFKYDVLKPISEAEFVGLEHYKELITGKELFTVLSHNLYYIVLYVPLVIIVSTFIAVLLNRDFKGVSFYKVLFYIPVVTSWVAGAVIWKWILNGKYGFLNQWLGFIGIQGPNWLTNETWAMPGVVIASIWKDSGYYALIILAALKNINKTYYEAAKIDGANAFQRLVKITIPLISPVIFLLFVLNLIYGFQVFDSVFIMTGGGPANATTVIVERIYRNAFKFYKMGYACAYSWILFAIIFVVTAIQIKLQKRWVNYDT